MAAGAGASDDFISKTGASRRKHGLPATADGTIGLLGPEHFTTRGDCRWQPYPCVQTTMVLDFIRKTGDGRPSRNGAGGAACGNGKGNGPRCVTSPTTRTSWTTSA